MGESFEFHKKLTKIQDDLRKREVDVRNRLADIEKKRVETLKRTEEMKYSALHDIEKIEQSIMKGKVDTETKKTLLSEIASLKTEMEKKYLELRSTIYSSSQAQIEEKLMRDCHRLKMWMLGNGRIFRISQEADKDTG